MQVDRSVLDTGWMCLCVCILLHPAVSTLNGVWDQDGTLELGRGQHRPPLTQSEDGVPALQRRFGEKTCTAVKASPL